MSLSRAPRADTFVAITSSSADLTVVGGGVTIPAGSTSAPVLVDGVAQAAQVTLTASLSGTSMTADVRVLGATEVAALALAHRRASAVAPVAR